MWDASRPVWAWRCWKGSAHRLCWHLSAGAPAGRESLAAQRRASSCCCAFALRTLSAEISSVTPKIDCAALIFYYSQHDLLSESWKRSRFIAWFSTFHKNICSLLKSGRHVEWQSTSSHLSAVQRWIFYSLHEIFSKFGIKCWNYWKKREKCEQSIECKPNAENRSEWGQLGTCMQSFQQVVAFS